MRLTISEKAGCSTRLVFKTKQAKSPVPGFSGEAGEVAALCEEGRVTVLCGCGEESRCTPGLVRSMAAKGIHKALDMKQTAVSLILPKRTMCGQESVCSSVEGVLLGAYRFTRYKTEKPVALAKLECIGKGLSAAGLKRIRTVCEAACYARDLVNENAAVITPARIAAEARSLAGKGGLRVTVLDEKQISRAGLHLLSAVGQGSPTPPRLVFMEYTGDRTSKKRQVIAGKGITFDSGGQNLKTTGTIETMRLDMAGAATVLGAMKAIAALKPRVNVVGCIAAAHNAVDGKAYFPGDIYPSFAGKTVEINSTDAEGRLVLADALAYSIKKYRPERIIDCATLTGSVLMALGEFVAGLFSNDDSLADALFTAGERTGERLWRFPLYQEYRDSLKSDLADLRNLSKFKKGYAGSITGAAFIQEFIGDTPWAHLDIAGTGWNDGGARGEVPQYGTGFGVRLLVDYLTSQ
ncbi:MAG: leucyl aminopeptidase family protein [Chitinispirillaceae bacterium]|nr:leucyl aminopeptidase family protein [Chitinispirillaceae bacterium]